jgi:hypothetical protein
MVYSGFCVRLPMGMSPGAVTSTLDAARNATCKRLQTLLHRLRRNGKARGVLIDDLPASSRFGPGNAGAKVIRAHLSILVREIEH